MLRPISRLVFGMVLGVSVAGLAAEKPEKTEAAEVPRFTFDLTDGSILVGTLSLNTLSVKSALGKVDVPITRIEKMEFRDDHEAVTILLDNGDKLSGGIELGKMELQTLFGKVTAETRLIKRIGKFSSREQKLRELVPTPEKKREMAQTILNELRQVDAAKDQYALENNQTGAVVPAWSDLTPYLKTGSKLAESGGADSLGNPIQIGAIQDRLRVSPDTKKTLNDAIGGDAFWGPFS